jgi:hypothetical protein
MRKIILASVVLFTLCGCDKDEQVEKANCVRVFMHQPGYYSVLDENFKSIIFSGGPCPVFRIIADVPANMPMWYHGIKNGRDWKSIEIHIHSPQDINGAGWNGGKGRLENTTIVE